MAKLTNHYPRRTISVDLDGTLCHDSRADMPGDPDQKMIDLVNSWYERGWIVIVNSSRPISHNLVVTAWLDHHGVNYHDCVCGAKPPADVYVDDKGLLPSLEALDALVAWKEQEDPLAALSGGAMAGWWAQEQLQVPEAGQEPPERNVGSYAVAVPVTGGMDSITLWAMAQEASVPAQPYYVDLGQEYAQAELDAARELTQREPTVIKLSPVTGRYAHIIPGRNAAIIFSIADALRTFGWWGELWLGNLAGEAPAVGGDKSARFLSTAQQLLTLLGYDLNLQSPLAALDKPDLVRWWAARDSADTLARTKSCFHPTYRACGSCQTCFRKLVAFHAAGGYDYLLEWDGPVDWSTHIAKYETAMHAAERKGDYSHYSRRRVQDTLATIAHVRGLGY